MTKLYQKLLLLLLCSLVGVQGWGKIIYGVSDKPTMTTIDYRSDKFAIAAIQALNAPILVSPLDITTLQATNTIINFQWATGGNDATTSYYFNLQNLTTGGILHNNTSVGSVTSYNATVAPGNKYAWYVEARKSGLSSVMSKTFTFSIQKTTSILEKPSLTVTPCANQSLCLQLDLTTTVPYTGRRQQFDISTSSTFDANQTWGINSTGNLSVSFFNGDSFSTNFQNNTPYYIRARVKNINDNTFSDYVYATYTFTGQASPCPNCITGQTQANFTKTGNEGYCAAQYLCSKSIIQTAQTNPAVTVTRQDVAKMTALALLNDSDITNVKSVAMALPTDNYPSPFIDAALATAEGLRYGRFLMYLQYFDDATPFDRRNLFNPNATITRADALKVLLEAWNIDEYAIDNLAPMPYGDVNSLTAQYRYIKKAYELGIITNQTNFRPTEACTREEFFVMLKRLRTSTTISKPNVFDIANYYVPANVTPANIHRGQGLAQGNFSHAEQGFSIEDIGIDLAFGFNYDANQLELPDQYHLFEPMGKGWSHNLNAYIYKIPTPIVYLNDNNTFTTIQEAQTMVHWGDGSIDIYKADNSPITPDNKNQITVATANQISIRTKNFSVYTFDKQGAETNVYRLTSIADKFGNQMNIVYKSITPKLLFLDNNAEYSYAIDYVQAPSGRRATFSYNTDGKVAQVSFPNETNSTARTIRFGYNDSRLASFINARGKTTTYTYGSSPKEYNLLKEVALPKGNKIVVGYDISNKVNNIKTLGVNNAVVSDLSITGVSNLWGADKKITPQITDNKTNIATTATIDKDGILRNSNTNNRNVLTIRDYTDSNNPSSPTKINTNGVISQYAYYPNGNLWKTTEPNGAVTEFFYDAFNNLTSIKDAKGNSTQYNFSADGRFLQNVKIPSSSGILTQSYTYYPNGLLKSSTNNENISANFTYNNQGNLIATNMPALNIQSSATYDYASRPKTSTNAKNQTTTFVYDPNDNLVGEKDPQNRNTTYDYDDNDNLSVINNAKGQQTTLGYDEYDRIKTETFDGKTKTYNYNPNDGYLTSLTKPSGNSFNYTYDPTSKRLKSNGYVTNIDYHPQTNLMTSIKGGSNPDHLLSEFLYDQNQRLQSYKDHYGNRVGYQYDLNGNTTKIEYPFSRDVTYEYDEANRLRKVFLQSGGTTRLVAEYVFSGSRLSYVQLGNGVRTTYGYDNAGRLNTQTTKTNNGTGTTICSYTYEMDNLGNHTKESMIEPFVTLPSLPSATTNYTYTNGNRIQTAGNINFGFDADGNTISKANTAFAYDKEDNLTTVTGTNTLSYEYDAFGNRRKAIRNGEETRYALDINGEMANVLTETNIDKTGNTAGVSFYIHGMGLVARMKISGALQYYHADFRGSVVAMTDANQNITHKYQYDEFGNLANAQEPTNDPNSFRYVGTLGVMHETNDLTFMRARYYDPTIGRFNSEDPIWSTNLYPYANNNGVMNVDASGEILDPTLQRYIEYEVNGVLNVFQNKINSLKNNIKTSIDNQVEKLKNYIILQIQEEAKTMVYTGTGSVEDRKEGQKALHQKFVKEFQDALQSQLCDAATKDICSIFKSQTPSEIATNIVLYPDKVNIKIGKFNKQYSFDKLKKGISFKDLIVKQLKMLYSNHDYAGVEGD